MKTIKFSHKELDFMRQRYQQELSNAENHIKQVKELLKKLAAPTKVGKDELTGKEPKQVKRRGRKPKVKTLEPKQPKKRGRPKAVVVEPKVPKKRGRPFKVTVIPTSEAKPVPTPATKEEKRIVRKKSPYRRRRSTWKGVRLAPLSKPIKLKEPKVEPMDGTAPKVEPIVPPTEESKE